MTDEERAVIDLMDELDGEGVLQAVYLGRYGDDLDPVDIAVAAARAGGWDDASGRIVLDALAKVPLHSLKAVYNLMPGQAPEWAPLDVAVYAWRASIQGGTL